MKPAFPSFSAGLVCLAAVTLASCDLRPASSIHVDSAFESYIPANAVFLAGADIDKIRDTPVFQKVIGAASGPQLETFVSETGLDPRKDLSRFVSWSDGNSGVILVHGKFNESELAAKLGSHGLKRTTYKGANFYGDDSNAVVFVDASTAAAGHTAAIHSMLDTYDPARRLSAALTAQLAAIPASSEIWAVFTGGVPMLGNRAGGGNLAGFLQVLQGITGGSLGLDVSQGVDLGVRVTCHTSDDARRVHDAARGLIGMGRLSTKSDQPDMLKVYDSIQVDQDQSSVKISAKLPQDLVDKFLQMWMQRRG
jgi:hypothetical protein